MVNIIITGASSGIGLSTAQYLKSQGYKVYPTARNVKDVECLKSLGFKAFLLDVTKAQTIKDTFKSILDIDDKIDVVFNNAGFGQPGAIEDLSTLSLKKQFETNVFGLHEVTIQALKIMKIQGYGKIIQHSSVLGFVSLKFRGAYNASKYAIEGLTDTLRLELSDTNIDVTLLNTGPIISSFRKNAKIKLMENINMESSRFKVSYEKSLQSNKSDVPFTLEAIEVSKIVEKIILSKIVKPRYYITKATYLLGYLKRILSTNLMDKILVKI